MQIGHVPGLHLALLLVVPVVPLVPLHNPLGRTTMIPSLIMLQKRFAPGILVKGLLDLLIDMF